MRLKLSEILSTIDQFNGTGEYSEQYDGGELVDINTELPDAPKQAKVSEGVEQIITDMLNENNIKNTGRKSLPEKSIQLCNVVRQIYKRAKGYTTKCSIIYG